MATTDDLFDPDGDGDGAAGSGDGEGQPAPQGDDSDAGKANSQTDARIAHWMSKAQTAEAEVNRLKGLDQKGKTKTAPVQTAGDAADEAPGAPAEAQPSEFESYMRESVRTQLFNEESRLKDFGYSLEDIAGDSLSEMKKSRDRLVKVIEKASSRALNEAFEKVGIDPALAGGSAERKDYAAMSEEEFAKEWARAKG